MTDTKLGRPPYEIPCKEKVQLYLTDRQAAWLGKGNGYVISRNARDLIDALMATQLPIAELVTRIRDWQPKEQNG